MRLLRPILIPAAFGLILLAIALMTRSGRFARKDPGAPISSAMRQAMGQASLPPGDAERLEQQFPHATLTPSGLRMRVDRPGEGGQPPLKGQVISVHYRGRLLDGTVIEDSYARGEGPLNVIAGKGLFEGWDEALLQMTVGEKRTVVVPYWLGFGDKGNPRRGVPPRATLVFELELMAIR